MASDKPDIEAFDLLTALAQAPGREAGGAPQISIEQLQAGYEIDEKLKNELESRMKAELDNIKEMRDDTLRRAIWNYRQTLVISWIMVFFGVILLASSMIAGYSSTEFKPFAAITAAVGVADF
ncbi:MAG: hypothetical protein ACREBU_23230, partial [Nitrososphaera sp.]